MADVLVDRADAVVTITLNRPHRRNAITGSLVEELIRALEDVARTPDDRAIVLTGAEGSFCSGMDLSEPLLPDVLTFMNRVGQLCTLLHDIPRPTIAKVAGPAMGFGCNLAFCCDLVVAGEDAVFGEIFAQRGIALDGGASWSLPRLVGIAKAKELVFFGEQVPAVEAERIGLVNRVLPNAELDAFVAQWAQRLADGPTLALSMMKSALNASFETAFRRAVDAEALNQTVAFGTAEAKEAGRAFRERRPPRFRDG
ncbi:enoyl-CoA hydratase [Streptomyces sp. NWU339]|uniref:enoyl-CoA hydratase/isomerase family protein n=1 Tax=Streptomyces sp. NWU339 TaxID=2185284 RepID=UPI000D679A08|nr:enoyl-CoA hydratase-related protein [Streptomyces sp. NWU339]PWI10421.1 enoyl-CoA hydratase [Streptomyces sp. NWU339]